MFENRKKKVLQKVSLFAGSLMLSGLIFAGHAYAQTVQTTESLKNSVTSPERLSASFAEVAKIVESAVVNIDTKGKVPEVTAKGGTPEDSDDILDFLRRQMPRRWRRACFPEHCGSSLRPPYLRIGPHRSQPGRTL